MQGLAGRRRISIFTPARFCACARSSIRCWRLPPASRFDRVAKDVDRDYIMEPDQAVLYGMIDRVIA